MLPVVTIIGLQVGLLLSGAVLTETVFAFARHRRRSSSTAITSATTPSSQGFILVIAVIFVMVNLLVDISYGFIDPSA